MVNFLQCHSTASCIASMHMNEGANFHDFGYKNLFYVLFVRPNYVQVYGVPKFLSAGMILIAIYFSGYHTLQSLDPD